MAERAGTRTPALEVRDLNVFYGASHALQGVNLTLEEGILSVVGRNGMGKTTLCKAIMGLVPAASGSVTFAGESLLGRSPSAIAQMGLGYVPQGRRLWRSLTVDEHLKMVATGKATKGGGAWTVERIYATFPRLAERKANGGGQLSGGEQQMLAIARALLTNPRLLVMDEPTEGLAPVIVTQVRELLLRLADEEGIDVLLIEQNIGVATGVSARTGIMVNGRVERVVDSATLAGNRELQQQLLGVGRHALEVAPEDRPGKGGEASAPVAAVTKVYRSNPLPPTRWSQPVPVRQLIQSARTLTEVAATSVQRLPLRPLASAGAQVVLVAGTLDTKGAELRYLRDLIRAQGLAVRLVDLSTSARRHSGAEVPAHEVAAWHPRGASGVFTSDRGEAVAGMALAFERWTRHQSGIAGMLSAGGSGGTALVAPAMRALPVGVPKLMVSTVASGDVAPYVGEADVTLMNAVADVQGLNSITRQVLGNAANALAGMVKGRASLPADLPEGEDRPALGLTMFGVTTPCVQQIVHALEGEHDCLVFHATGAGGRAMERLVDEGRITSVIDITTTEVCDLLFGGALPATEDRFGAIIRTRLPYIGSVGALDMVNFHAMDTVPERYRGRTLYAHNPQVTLMRTTADENARLGRWIGERLNLMEGPVRFFLPEGGVSALDAPGQPFHDPAADRALFEALAQTVRATAQRQLIRLPFHINAPEFAAAVVAAHHALAGPPRRKRAQAR